MLVAASPYTIYPLLQNHPSIPKNWLVYLEVSKNLGLALSRPGYDSMELSEAPSSMPLVWELLVVAIILLRFAR